MSTYYDYKNQAWVKNDKYVRCGHAEDRNCDCYGRLHEGEKPEKDIENRYGR